jgi:DNA primase
MLVDRQIPFREGGRDYIIKCLNPEHEDSNPSLRIDKVTGIFQCFSCGFKGNIFKHFGAEPNYVDLKIAGLQNKIRNMLNNKTLQMPIDAVPFDRDYRGISSYIFRSVNAFTSNAEEVFENRLMFPIPDIRGNIKVFLGRSLHSDVKSKYMFYPEHTSPPIFPAHPEIYKNSLIIVEGIFDVLNMMDKGCYNVITAFGTNTLFKNYRDKLSHYKIMGVNKFYIMFDGDTAGSKASVRLEKLLNENGFNAEMIIMPEGKDPGDFTEDEVSKITKGLYGRENSGS